MITEIIIRLLQIYRSLSVQEKGRKIVYERDNYKDCRNNLGFSVRHHRNNGLPEGSSWHIHICYCINNCILLTYF